MRLDHLRADGEKRDLQWKLWPCRAMVWLQGDAIIIWPSGKTVGKEDQPIGALAGVTLASAGSP